MSTKEKRPEDVVIKCDVCMKEVPVSEAKSAEATDYVAHFCGLVCYEKWSKQAEKE